jgi:hypothetical protein
MSRASPGRNVCFGVKRKVGNFRCMWQRETTAGLHVTIPSVLRAGPTLFKTSPSPAVLFAVV